MRTVPLLVCSLVLALTTPAIVAAQTVWKWVDEKGVTHFSDQPIPGATKMELNSSVRSSAEAAPAYTPPPQQSASRQSQQGPVYARFAIEQPQQDEAVVNTGGQVRISLAVAPGLRGDDTITVYLDGAPVADFPPTALSHELSNVPRGTHTVRAVITNSQGAVVQETPVSTFHVRQTSAAQPPVGPALRNPSRRPNAAGNKLPTQQPSYVALNGAAKAVDSRTNLPPPAAKTMPAGPKSGN